MDSSQNWLAFSLSNHQSSSPSSSHAPLSLFEPFPNPSHHSQTDSLSSLSCAFDENSLNLSMFPLGPKLEDFLGGSNAMTVSQFSGENQHQTADNTTLYGTGTGTGADSELKNIAASFLRGYSSSMNDQTLTTIEPESIPSASASAASTALAVVPVVESSTKKAVDTFGQRTSIYRGVTRHRWTGRYEAHLWDNSCRREGQSRKGRQVYLGGYDKEDKAARAYDLAALKYWGPTTTTNFPVTNYEKELEEMQNMSRQEFVASLRRKSSGFSRGASIYRGVTRHHQHGRWQARIGRVAGNKDLYLGTFSTQEEAAEAYDIAAIKFRGLNAVTNFDMSRYDVKSIASSNLPIGGVSGKAKATSESHSDNRSSDGSRSDERDLSSVTSVSFASQPSSSSTTLNFAMPIKQDPSDQYWPLHSYQNNYQTVGTTTNAYAAYHGLTGLNMDFNVGTNGYVQVQQQGGANTIPFGTPMNLLQQQQQQSNSYESSGGSGASYGNWGVTPSGHVFQTGKPNISVYQTPIYGME